MPNPRTHPHPPNQHHTPTPTPHLQQQTMGKHQTRLPTRPPTLPMRQDRNRRPPHHRHRRRRRPLAPRQPPSAMPPMPQPNNPGTPNRLRFRLLECAKCHARIWIIGHDMTATWTDHPCDHEWWENPPRTTRPTPTHPRPPRLATLATRPCPHPPLYRLWVNDDSTLLVRQWNDGTVEIAERDDPSHVWGPPITSSALPSWINNLKPKPVY
jgi:hypothetical protein